MRALLQAASASRGQSPGRHDHGVTDERTRPALELESRWKEEVVVWAGADGFLLDGGWGVTPRVAYVPSASTWDAVVPAWLVGRRPEVVALLEATGDRVVDTDRGYAPGTRVEERRGR